MKRYPKPSEKPSLARAQHNYGKKKPVAAFRLEISEREQMEMIREAKESLNAAVKRVFRVGLEAMKGEK